MGVIHQHIRLANAARDDLEEIDALALVNSGAMELCIPQHIANQLRLRTYDQREITVADGRRVLADYVGPVRVEAFGRTAVGGAVVTGDQVLLGAIPMESMDVLIDPARLRLMPNPQNPNIPGTLAVGVRPAREERD